METVTTERNFVFTEKVEEYQRLLNSVTRSTSSSHHGGYLSDTPPNTPSSGGNDESLQPILKTTDPRFLTDSIIKESRKPNGGSFTMAKDSGLESEEDDLTRDREKERDNRTDNYWIGQRLSEKKDLSAKTPALKSYWEDNCDKEEKLRQQAMAQPQRRPFAFPKWRSNDPMTASLVASGKVSNMIPKDSYIPEHRKQKIEETERKAEIDREQIQQLVASKKPMQKGKSLESLTMQMDHQPWYDRERIKESISRESIANIGAVREKFERGDYDGRKDPNQRQFVTDFGYSRSMTTTPAFKENSSRPSTAMGKPLPPIPSQGNAYLQQQQHSPDDLPPAPPQHSLQGQQRAHHQQQHHANHHHSHQQQQQVHQFHHQQPQHQQVHGYHQGNAQNQVNHQQYQHQQSHQRYPQDFHQQPPSHHGSNSAINLSPDHYLLLQYIKQNPNIFNDFGIEIPKKLFYLAEDMPFPQDTNHHIMNRQNAHTPVQPVPPTPQKGRYVKNSANSAANQGRFRRTYDMSLKQVPENRRQSMQDLDHVKAGNGLIEAEIRAMREREEDLRRSRSELGLPSLEDTLETWRHGYQNKMSQSRLRSLSSVDHLNQPFNGGSCDELRFDEEPALARPQPPPQQQQHYAHEKQGYVNGTAHGTEPFEQQPEQYEQQQLFEQPRPHPSQAGGSQSSYYKENESFFISSANQTKDRRGASETRAATNSPFYRLHRSQDPDVMIYAPSANRKISTPTVKMMESPALGQSVNGLRNIRYE